MDTIITDCWTEEQCNLFFEKVSEITKEQEYIVNRSASKYIEDHKDEVIKNIEKNNKLVKRLKQSAEK